MDFTDVIKIKTLEMGRLSWIISLWAREAVESEPERKPCDDRCRVQDDVIVSWKGTVSK